MVVTDRNYPDYINKNGYQLVAVFYTWNFIKPIA
ncbi:hypothetical protein GFO_0775 [Christiangramia forsetii KT0803]|uniref:Uncharacterized protein n=1 Tax=Christiangramia forsetii (strain DSM 17595 / CGMCC 1.15422 / KT0803) TaxID=411154 RepID=A0LZF6_CHRFK|nr:hypothetical protein GFO_0775 [Christiangramia forsetii KT0803]